MRTIELQLRKEIYDELTDAASCCAKDDEEPCTPEEFAKEAIECVLAARRVDVRRLERIAALT